MMVTATMIMIMYLNYESDNDDDYHDGISHDHNDGDLITMMIAIMIIVKELIITTMSACMRIDKHIYVYIPVIDLFGSKGVSGSRPAVPTI